MKYLHSRLALAGVVVAWPLMQLGGCAQKEREFLTSAGAGGDLSGGGMAGEDGATGGKGGSSGGKAGSGSGGKAGSSSSTGGSSTGGKGGSSTGGKGGSTGGAGGSGNTNAGGEGGEVTDPGCVPTGVEVCNDGIDNDCDTLTDCLRFKDGFPEENGAAAGGDVNWNFQAKHSTASFECRAAKGASVPATTAWGPCPRDSGTGVFPIDPMAASAATNDGVWSTQVRLAFPDGTHSAAFTREVYIHSSLNGVTRCPVEADDEQYFAAAAADLEDTGAFDETTVRNPFIQITFTPPLDGRYAVFSGDGVVRALSLRRRFVFDDTGHFLLMTRNYESRLAGNGCTVVQKRVHNTRGTWSLGFDSYQSCTGFVMNSAGAGYCITATGGTVASAEWVRQDYAAQIPDSMYSPRADNFAWRKVFLSRNIYGYQTHFSPACDMDGCAAMSTSILFMPDKSFYPYW